MEIDKGLVPMRFPNEFDGTMDVTSDELCWMVENGHATVRAQKIRSETLKALGDFYRPDAPVES